MTGPEEPDEGPPEHLNAIAGMDLVRRALEEARAVAREQGKEVGKGRRSPAARRAAPRGSRRRWSGPAPDARDPQPLGRAAGELAKTRGWSPRVAEGSVFARWGEVVGDQIAAHATPTALRDGVLRDVLGRVSAEDFLAAAGREFRTELTLAEDRLGMTVAQFAAYAAHVRRGRRYVLRVQAELRDGRIYTLDLRLRACR